VNSIHHHRQQHQLLVEDVLDYGVEDGALVGDFFCAYFLTSSSYSLLLRATRVHGEHRRVGVRRLGALSSRVAARQSIIVSENFPDSKP
jgi:hypothetical protein